MKLTFKSTSYYSDKEALIKIFDILREHNVEVINMDTYTLVMKDKKVIGKFKTKLVILESVEND